MFRAGWVRHLPMALLLCGLLPPVAVPGEEHPGLPTKPAVPPPVPIKLPQPADSDRPLPINLATALKLAQARNLDVAIAAERTRLALAQYDRARVLWLPTLYLGGDYFRHDGQLQDVAGKIFGPSKSTLMAGVGPSMVFAVTDAIFEPLAAHQIVQARQAGEQAASNDTMLSVAEAYFTVQQSRGELAGAEDAVRQAEEVLRRTEKLAPGLVPALEVTRVRTELARRRLAGHAARERWRLTSSELARLLRLEPTVLVEPLEPPHLEVALVPPSSLDDLVHQGLTSRPELAGQQALVQAVLQRLKQERLRPLVPSVLLRGTATNPAGTLSSGVFGGGERGRIGDFSSRNSMDLQLIWEIQHLGLGNRARVQERRSEHELALLELFRLQDRIAAEVAQASAQVQSAASRTSDAETGLKAAVESARLNIEGMSQTKRPGGEIVLLVVRPQEAVAAVQALGQAYTDFYGAVADYNRAQFRLYRALGNPGHAVICETPPSLEK